MINHDQKPTISVCLLAAGAGVRLKYPLGKPMLPFLGRPLIHHGIERCIHLKTNLENHGKIGQFQLGIVLGHQKDLILENIEKSKTLHNIHHFYAHQKELLGTADALKSFFLYQPTQVHFDYTLVSCVDTPLIDEQMMEELFDSILANPNLEMMVGVFKASNPTGLGRMVQNPKLKIVEEKDASPEEREIDLVNSGLYIFKTSFLKNCLEKITPSPVTKEYYLTDTCLHTHASAMHIFQDEYKFLGINNPKERIHLEMLYEKIQREKLIQQGVLFYHPESITFHGEVTMGVGCVIYPNVLFQGKVQLGDYVQIMPNCVIKDSTIDSHAVILENTSMDGAIIGPSAHIGPMARIRPQSKIGKQVKIGNFVEIKKVELEENVKVSHLSYLGDAKVGKNTNIGCGFITCNYDGLNKHETKIGENCFIGSDTQMIAPIEIGNQCFVASGSTINKNMPDESFAIARSKMELKLNLAKKFLK